MIRLRTPRPESPNHEENAPAAFLQQGRFRGNIPRLPTKRPGFEAGRKGGGGTSGRTVPGSDGNGGAQSGRYPIRTGTTGCRRTSSSGSERYRTCPKSIARRSMLRIVLSYIVR